MTLALHRRAENFYHANSRTVAVFVIICRPLILKNTRTFSSPPLSLSERHAHEPSHVSDPVLFYPSARLFEADERCADPPLVNHRRVNDRCRDTGYCARRWQAPSTYSPLQLMSPTISPHRSNLAVKVPYSILIIPSRSRSRHTHIL
ncbi:hypothetical protein A0H81_10506 [Grifola frondosa]|uniref:Uncharacterized protein n=1 Tax=Grifola frondosa TaxID=5627 RepID=A0A1C7LZY6_GRIFR|nr:hypothetical protein A0H81_10506 [Grifola frondosa]